MPKVTPHVGWIFSLVVVTATSCGAPQREVTTGLVGRPEAPAADDSRANLWYHVGLDEDVLDIHTRLYAPPKRTTFFLPGHWAGRDDYDDGVRLAGARTSDGPADLVISRDRGEVTVETPGAEWVELHYRVELAPRSDYHPQLDRGVLVAFGPTFLVTPAKQVMERTRSIPVEVLLPNDWTIVSTWSLHDRTPSSQAPDSTVHGFIASDVRQLRDAFLVAGDTLRTERRGEDDRLVEIAFGPAVEGDTARFADWVHGAANEFRARYGSVGPIHAYVRTREATQSEMRGLGRRGGFVIDVPPEAELSATTRLLVAHETLHLWNGHSLVPSSDAERETRWFKEGVTHYLALKMLARTGRIDESVLLDELAEAAANYERNPVTAGARARPRDRARYPYDFGVLVALGFDASLTKRRGDIGLQCWLVELLRSRDEPYDELGLLGALRRCAPDDGRRVSQSWRHWVRMRRPIDVRALFRQIGLHWLPPAGDRDARLMPLDRERALYRRLFDLEEIN